MGSVLLSSLLASTEEGSSVPRPIKRLGQVGGLVIQRKELSWNVKVLSKQDDFLKDSKGKEQTKKKPHMKC